MAIEWGSRILNDCLYLGVKNGAVHPIIPTGAQLPYTSPVMTGFKIEPGQNQIAIPIKSQNLDGSYRTIANGNISFKKKYRNGAFVAFEIAMGENKVITMTAWTSEDPEGKGKLETGYVEIAMDNQEQAKLKSKCIAPEGSRLDAKAEINNLIQLCQNYEKCRDALEKRRIAKRIGAGVSSICNAGNKDAFADVILDRLANIASEEARMRIFTIARRIGRTWGDAQKKGLARACMNQIDSALHGLSASGGRVSTNIQAIYTLSICGAPGQLARLCAIHGTSAYLQACLYTHGKTRTDIRWLQEELEKDVRKAMKNQASNIQFSAHAIGIALQREEGCEQPAWTEEQAAACLCDAIRAGNLDKEELISCILALGCICDQRAEASEIKVQVFREVTDTDRKSVV